MVPGRQDSCAVIPWRLLEWFATVGLIISALAMTVALYFFGGRHLDVACA
jgi:hypothetical protein